MTEELSEINKKPKALIADQDAHIKQVSQVAKAYGKVRQLPRRRKGVDCCPD